MLMLPINLKSTSELVSTCSIVKRSIENLLSKTTFKASLLKEKFIFADKIDNLFKLKM